MNRPVAVTARRRRVLALACCASGALVLSGCSVMSPTQTQRSYAPADGVPVSVGPVQARDLVLVAAQKDAAGVLSGAVINTGDQPVTVSFMTREQAESPAGTSGGGPSIQLNAREQKRLSQVLDRVPVIPGAMTGVVLVTDKGRALVNVPVLPPQGYYATLTPSAAPSGSPTPAG